MSLHETMTASTITPERLAQWEAESRARDARLEYGVTIDDLRRFLKRALRVQIAVRVGSDSSTDDVSFPTTTAHAVRNMFRAYGSDEIVPCEFDPVERTLIVGGLRSLYNAREFRRR